MSKKHYVHTLIEKYFIANKCCHLNLQQIGVVTSKITDVCHITNVVTVKMFGILQELSKCDRHEVRNCCWKNGTNRIATCRVATDFQFVKNA